MQEKNINECIKKSIDELIELPFMSDVLNGDDNNKINEIYNLNRIELFNHCIKHLKMMYSTSISLTDSNINIFKKVAELQKNVIIKLNATGSSEYVDILLMINDLSRYILNTHTTPYIELSNIILSFCKNCPVDNNEFENYKNKLDVINICNEHVDENILNKAFNNLLNSTNKKD